MKKLLFALLLCAGFALPALGQSNPPLRLQEIDGTPNVLGVTTIKVTNGTLSCSGKVCTITISGGGGGSPGGSNTQVQYNAAGSFGGAAGFTFNGTSTISLGVAGSSVGAIGFRNATSGTITLQPVTGALGTVTLSLPAVTDTLVGLAAAQTLTNKTLTTPVIAQISNTGTLTLPTSTDTLVGRATTDTLTNKTLSTSNTVSAALTWTAGVKQTFAPNGTTAGINVGSVAGDPSAPANGDLWYDSTANELTARINGANVALGSGGGGGITIGTTTITSGTNTRVLYNNAGVVGEYTVTGTAGNVVLSTSPTITTPAITTSQTTTRDSIGVTSTDGIVLQNTTAAAAGAQQYSPRLRLTGQGWKTNATAASQTTDWILEARPVQGAASPTVNLAMLYQVNGGGYTDAIATGQILVPGGGSSSQAVNQIAGINNSGNGVMFGGGQAGNAVHLRINNNTIFVADANAGFVAGITTSLDFLSSAGSFTGRQIRLTSPASGKLRLGGANGTDAGNLIIGTSTVGDIGTSGVSVLAIASGTAPTTSPADTVQYYSADSAAGDANAFARNEAGEVNRLTGLSARVSTQFDKTSDTTLANVTGLSRNVEAGRTYAFTAVLYTTSNVAGGVKAAIGGTATATSIIYQAEVLDGSTLATVGTARATSLATTVGDVTAVTAARITISGTIVVNAAGTLVPQFAQNASNGTASSVLVNSSFQLVPIS